MKINKSSVFLNNYKSLSEKNNIKKSPEDKDKFKYKESDLNDKGLLPVIVWSKDSMAINRVRSLKSIISEIDPKSRFKCDLDIINGFAVSIDPKCTKKLIQKNPGIIFSLDSEVKIPEGEFKPVSPDSKLDNAIPSLNIDKLWEKGFTGRGVTIAIVDTGIHKHPDLINRIIDFKDIVNYKDGVENAYDDYGHGTHCAGDAAGDGRSVNNKYKGPAYEANLMGVKVLRNNGSSTFSDVIRGIDYVYKNKEKFNVKVMSLSLGARATSSWADDPCANAVEKVSYAGILPVVAAGNSGPVAGSIGTPGISPSAVTVGAIDDKNTPEKNDDVIPDFSSRGPTEYDKMTKPNIMTPGVDIISTGNNGGYVSATGTSMAAPVMAGIAACLFQAAPFATMDQMKKAIYETADEMNGYSCNDQGAGVADPLEALEFLIGK